MKINGGPEGACRNSSKRKRVVILIKWWLEAESIRQSKGSVHREKSYHRDVTETVMHPWCSTNEDRVTHSCSGEFQLLLSAYDRAWGPDGGLGDRKYGIYSQSRINCFQSNPKIAPCNRRAVSALRCGEHGWRTNFKILFHFNSKLKSWNLFCDMRLDGFGRTTFCFNHWKFSIHI